MRIAAEEASQGSLREVVYVRLRKALLAGELQPGEALSEVALAQRFRTSRSPIRDALGRLEQEGYVVRKPNGRGVVAPLDTKELCDLYQVRAAVEGLAAGLAVPHLTGLALDELARHLDRMRACSLAGDIDASLEAGAGFHDVICRHCPNLPLREIVESVRTRIKRYRQVIAGLRDRDVRIGEHVAILRALEQRDAAAAEKAMREHVLRSAATLMAGVADAGHGGRRAGYLSTPQAMRSPDWPDGSVA